MIEHELRCKNIGALTCGTAVLQRTEHARYQLHFQPQIDLLVDIAHANHLIPIIVTEPADVPAGRSDIDLQVCAAGSAACMYSARAGSRPDCELWGSPYQVPGSEPGASKVIYFKTGKPTPWVQCPQLELPRLS